jgi:6-phosphogluconate dehydrogenase
MSTDKPMQLGMIGLGRMGANLVRRLMGDGHRCVVYDVNAAVVKELEGEGATGSASAEPTPSRGDREGTAPDGYLHCGPSGAGHFVKMVHNGVEYGMMASIAEGLSIIRHANVGNATQVADAETTPLRDPEAYQYDIDPGEVAELWRRGSVVGSWLMDLTADAFARSPGLDDFAGRVSDSGEGRWTVLAAVDEGVPAPVITASLFERFESRRLGDFSDKILSAMRSEFGGHAEKQQ